MGEPIQFLDRLFYYRRYITTSEGKCQGFLEQKFSFLLMDMRLCLVVLLCACDTIGDENIAWRGNLFVRA